jgi:hypothetical protein
LETTSGASVFFSLDVPLVWVSTTGAGSNVFSVSSATFGASVGAGSIAFSVSSATFAFF